MDLRILESSFLLIMAVPNPTFDLAAADFIGFMDEC
jgi:hypothetical protein